MKTYYAFPFKCLVLVNYIIEKNRSYSLLSWDYYKRPIVIFWFRMYWCSSRQERETGIEMNQKNFSHTLLIKQWHAPILYKPKFLLLIRKRECQAREKFLLFFSMITFRTEKRLQRECKQQFLPILSYCKSWICCKLLKFWLQILVNSLKSILKYICQTFSSKFQ